MPGKEDAILLRSIARRLAETADRGQVIEELCILQNWDWGTAEEVVEQAWREHHPEITRRQSPILVPLAFSIFIGGAMLASWQLLGLVAVVSALVKPQLESYLDLYNVSFGLIDTLANLPGMMVSFSIGLAMVLGSYFGMKDVFSAWLDALEQGKKPLEDNLPALNEFPSNSQIESTSPQQPEMVYSASGWVRNRPDDAKLAQFVLDQIEKSDNKDWVINAVALARGLRWQPAKKLVEAVAEANGITFKDEITYGPPVVFSVLGVFITGLVITFQYLLLAGVVLAPQFTRIRNSWDFMQFMFALGDYIQMGPGAFVLYALGLVMLVGGFMALRKAIPSVYRWQDSSLGLPR